ncbi:MAG: type III pantothenate kinase [bacterium]|nr:type III pantothenate kinase [bacterium]
MILVADIGNTHIHLGLFIRGSLRETWTLSSVPARTPDEYRILLRGLVGENISYLKGAIVSSVVPRLEWPFSRAIEKEFELIPMILTKSTNMGILNGYEHPDEVGMDRLANAAGANYMYGPPALVLDFGTAITLDYLAEPLHAGHPPIYIGGAILPGIEMAAEALVRGTAQLPRVPLAEPPHVLGRTTVQSIQSGLTHGYLGAIQTLVERAWEEIGQSCRVIATGGDALNLKEHLPFLHAVEPELTLYGLRQIYGINNDCPLPSRENGSTYRDFGAGG